ncbi:MAG: hypothetical protein ABI665_09685 [Vicinamibacterales bacterium]
MPITRILLVRDGDFFIHVYQLARLLAKAGLDVEILNTSNAEPEPLYRDLIAQTRALGIPCHLVTGPPPWLEGRLLALGYQLHIVTKRAAITPHKVRESLKVLSTRPPFDLVIAFDPSSLYLACQLFRNELSRIVEYSLEVSDESHGDFQTRRTERSFRLFERSTLPQLRALLIQDRFRAQVLLRHVRHAEKVRTIFFPVAMSGPGRRPAPRPAGAGEARVLFFGGLWSEAFLRELQLISTHFRDGQVLMIRGGRGAVRSTPVDGSKVDVSTEPIPFAHVNDVIATADLGLAIYPSEEANSRCSAFASEKVARYLQCGIPFIAFDHEDYAFLRAETGCCELVASYAEVPDAVNRIMDNYERYQRGAVAAFERFYWHDITGPALLRELARD